jgi:hypothetical protein
MEGQVTQPQCPEIAICNVPYCPVFNRRPFYYHRALRCILEENEARAIYEARRRYEKDFGDEANAHPSRVRQKA